jgi:hypothetical protein
MNKAELIEKIINIGELEDKWDGENGVRVPKTVINACRYLLDNLHTSQMPNFICPCDSGNAIQFEWDNRSNFLEIEINKKEVSYLKGSYSTQDEGVLFEYKYNGIAYNGFDIDKIQKLIEQMGK